METENKDYTVGYPLATPTDRILAGLIDWLIIGLLCATGFGAIIGIAYLLTKESLPLFDGQSIGKKVLRIRAVDNDSYQSIKNKYDKSLMRNISLLIPVFQFIDAFMIFSSDRKRFGDQWANTIVIKDI
ncbi:MAG: RDD family protein [Cyclobacteriaceae bacterium]|nr:RDD family protein [Cyclobacteriaceae bacterium]